MSKLGNKLRFLFYLSVVLQIATVVILTQCATLNVGNSSMVVEVCSKVRGYRDYDIVDKLRYSEPFYVYFEPKVTYRNELVDVRIDMSMVYPDGSSIDDTIIQGQYRVRDRDSLFLAVPLIVPRGIQVGMYTAIVTVYDNYTGKSTTGRATFKVIASQLAGVM